MGNCLTCEPIRVESVNVRPIQLVSTEVVNQKEVSSGDIDTVILPDHIRLKGSVSERNEMIHESLKSTPVFEDTRYLKIKTLRPNWNVKAIAGLIVFQYFQPQIATMNTYWDVFLKLHAEILSDNQITTEQLTQHGRVAVPFFSEMCRFYDQLIFCNYKNKQTIKMLLDKIRLNNERLSKLIDCGLDELKSTRHQCKCS
jgi:hypothetical protein